MSEQKLIRSFANPETERFWNGERTRQLPGNRLHELKDDRTGQFSISINKQWRMCFRWKDGSAYDVEIADYH